MKTEKMKNGKTSTGSVDSYRERAMSEVVGVLVALLVIALLWGVVLAAMQVNTTDVHTYEPYKPPRNTPPPSIQQALRPAVWFYSPAEGQSFYEVDSIPFWGGLWVEQPHEISIVQMGADTVNWSGVWHDNLTAWDGGAIAGLVPGVYTMYAQARDWRGLWSEVAAVNFSVIPLPPPNITSITAVPDVVFCNEAVYFNASVQSMLPIVEWWWTDGAVNLSDRQGFTATLPTGEHTINLRVRDAAGHWSGWASVNVTVVSPNATAVIDSITPLAVDEGEPVTFTGHGEADYGVFIDYRWHSNVDGLLGKGETVTATLSAGRHVITFSALHECDEGWAEAAADTVTIDVAGAPTPCYPCPPGTGARDDVKQGSIYTYTLTPDGGRWTLGGVSWQVLSSEGECYYPGSGATDIGGWGSIIYEYGESPGDGTIFLSFEKLGYDITYALDNTIFGGGCTNPIHARLRLIP